MLKSTILTYLLGVLLLAAQQKPNIILIMADDLGYHGLGIDAVWTKEGGFKK